MLQSRPIIPESRWGQGVSQENLVEIGVSAYGVGVASSNAGNIITKYPKPTWKTNHVFSPIGYKVYESVPSRSSYKHNVAIIVTRFPSNPHLISGKR